jgi:2-oxoglutarate dehydrogenase E2 component (dihydrolipoamide succinyltransferase)
MPIEVRVPPLPESVSDATLVAWHKKAGDSVQRDETLVDLETDKVVLEVSAPRSGVLRQVLRQDGEKVTGEELIALIDTEETHTQTLGTSGDAAHPEADVQQDEPAVQIAEAGGGSRAPTMLRAPAAAAAETKAAPPLPPSVRRLLAEHQLEARDIPASGRGGRLTKEDILKYLQRRQEQGAPGEEEPVVVPGGAVERALRQAPQVPGERPTRRVPMTRLRARIAERLVQAQQNAAILTTINEIDMQAVTELRRLHREEFERRHKVKLGLMGFFVKACVEALRRFPVVNASVDGSDILYHDYYDIGIAVDSERGLVVPVLRDADRLTFASIESDIAAFAQRAREGTLTIEDLTGGTFTISNGGVFGSLLSTPILNPPQSAIVGMHKIEERPVVLHGDIRVRPMMYVALSYDHRIVDGRDAVRFLVTVKDLLEDPVRLLLEV